MLMRDNWNDAYKYVYLPYPGRLTIYQDILIPTVEDEGQP